MFVVQWSLSFLAISISTPCLFLRVFFYPSWQVPQRLTGRPCQALQSHVMYIYHNQRETVKVPEDNFFYNFLPRLLPAQADFSKVLCAQAYGVIITISKHVWCNIYILLWCWGACKTLILRSYFLTHSANFGVVFITSWHFVRLDICAREDVQVTDYTTGCSWHLE